MNTKKGVSVVEGYTWLGIWFLLNIGVTLLNKSLFRTMGFKFPITLTLVHMIFTSICSNYIVLKEDSRKILPMNRELRMVMFSLLFCANIVVGNAALRYCTVSLVQVVRSVIPGITVVLSIVFQGKTYGTKYFGAIAFVIVGVALASYGEVEFDLLGFIFTLVVCFLSSMKTVTTGMFLVGQNKLQPFDLLSRMSTYAAFELLFLPLVFQEWNGLKEWNGTGFYIFLLCLNGFLAFFLNYANFMTNKLTSPLTVTVAGNMKHVVTIFISIWLFETQISLLNGIGSTIAIIGAIYYSYIDYVDKYVMPAAGK